MIQRKVMVKEDILYTELLEVDIFYENSACLHLHEAIQVEFLESNANTMKVWGEKYVSSRGNLFICLVGVTVRENNYFCHK